MGGIVQFGMLPLTLETFLRQSTAYQQCNVFLKQKKEINIFCLNIPF